MRIEDVHRAVSEAEAEIRRVDSSVGDMAALITGRLRKSGASPYVLEALKRELRDYNIHTGLWKER